MGGFSVAVLPRLKLVEESHEDFVKSAGSALPVWLSG